MKIAAGALAAGWIPFVIVTVLVSICSFIYIRFYRHRTHSNYFSLIVAFLGLAVASATCALVPVDIFLVSFMKDAHGNFKPWAETEENRDFIKNGLLYTYYALYGCIIFFLFFLLPFAFFYCDDTQESMRTRQRCCNGFKYSLVFIFMAVVIIMIGTFVPFGGVPQNKTVLVSELDILENSFEDFADKHGERAVSFTMSTLTVLGMFPLILYLGCGMAVWPMDLIKGRRDAHQEYAEYEAERASNRAAVASIQGRQTLSSGDRRRIDELNERERLIQRTEHHLLSAQNTSCFSRCMRPFYLIFGIFCVLLSCLVCASLILTNVDKLLYSLGPLHGYSILSHHLPNPIDMLLVCVQQVFPLDYILVIGLILFLFICMMAAIKNFGIWFCWVRMFKIRFGRTRPQGLLMLCFILMLSILALNVLVYEIAPQYGSFGSQKYVKNITTEEGNTTLSVLPCSLAAGDDECVMTRMSLLLFRFLYKIWFFGVIYYWTSWVLPAIFILALIVAVLRKSRSSVAGEVDENEFDSDSDDNR